MQWESEYPIKWKLCAYATQWVKKLSRVLYKSNKTRHAYSRLIDYCLTQLIYRIDEEFRSIFDYNQSSEQHYHKYPIFNWFQT